MKHERISSEYIAADDGTEICPECGHIWGEDGAGHYHDCRYFTLEDQLDDVEHDEEMFRQPQLSLFRPAA